MTDKTIDKKTLDHLAIIAAAKTSPDDDIVAVTRKVVADYIEAKKVLHNELSTVKKPAKAAKEKTDSKGKKAKKTLQKSEKQAAGE